MRQVGDIRVRQGRLADAAIAFSQALQQNEALAARAPQDTDRLFELAQAEFWTGYALSRKGDVQAALLHIGRYLDRARDLERLAPDSAEYALEVGYANTNLGALHTDLGNLADAQTYFAAAEAKMQALLDQDPDNDLLQGELAQVFAWQGITALALGRLSESVAHHAEQEDLLRQLSVARPDDKV